MAARVKLFRLEILVFVLFVVSRMFSLGHDNFNTDVWRWKARTYDFGNGVFQGDFKKTIQVYHPGVSLMWVGSAGVKFYNLQKDLVKKETGEAELTSIFGLDFFQKLFIVLVTGFTIASIFYSLRLLFGVTYATISIALISLEPFFVALSRVIHLEGLMSIFLLAAFVWFYFYLENKFKTRYLVLAAFFSALALLTKSSAFFIVLFTILMAFTFNTFSRKAFTQVGKYLLLVVLFFFILWPGMWVAPGEALKAYTTGIFTVGVEGGHEQFYFGKFTLDPGPTFYPIVFVFRSSVYVLIGLIGYLITFRKIKDQKLKVFTLYALLFTLIYAVEVTIPSKKLDRYLLPSIISSCLVGAAFYSTLLEKLSKSRVNRKVIFSFLLFAPSVLTAVILHPDYLSYYNPLVGGLRKGINVIEPKWMIGVPEIVEYFQEKLDSGEVQPFYEGQSLSKLLYKKELHTKLTVAFPEKYYSQVWPFIREMGGWAIVEALGPEAQNAYYFVYPVWEDRSTFKDEYGLKFEGTINIRGVPVYNVYKRSQ